MRALDATLHAFFAATVLFSSGASSAAGNAAAPAEGSAAPVATVDGEPVSADAVREEMVRRGADAVARLRGPEAREEALEEVIRRHVLAREALERGLDRDPEIEDAIRRLLAEAVWSDVVAGLDVPEVTDEDVRRAYEGDLERYTEPLRYRASVIVLRPTGGETLEGLREEASRLLAEARSIDDEAFARLAREHSEDPRTAPRGGDIGWVVEDASVFGHPAEVLDALFALEEPGDVAPLVETDRLFAIVRLTGLQGGEPLPLAVVGPQIRRRLAVERREDLLAEEWTNLRAEHEISIDRETLETIGPADPGSAFRPPSFPVGDSP